MKEKLVVLPREVIEQRIYLIRGQKVLLDSDLAQLYGVATSNLNKAVKRNSDRFPQDFMFPLSKEEFESHEFYKEVQHSRREFITLGAWDSQNRIINYLLKKETISPSIGHRVCHCARLLDDSNGIKAQSLVS